MEGESLLGTQFETCCDADLPLEFVDRVRCLLKDLEETPLFLVVDAWVQGFKERSRTNNVRCPKMKVSSVNIHKNCTNFAGSNVKDVR